MGSVLFRVVLAVFSFSLLILYFFGGVISLSYIPTVTIYLSKIILVAVNIAVVFVNAVIILLVVFNFASKLRGCFFVILIIEMSMLIADRKIDDEVKYDRIFARGKDVYREEVLRQNLVKYWHKDDD